MTQAPPSTHQPTADRPTDPDRTSGPSGTTSPSRTTSTSSPTDHVDVLIVGAGVSGIGVAHHLREQFPDRSFTILEGKDSYGGTWLTHTFPGIRSDSDLYTYGYRHKPWTGPSIATADEIRAYLGSVIDEDDLARHIRYRHRVTGLDWDSGTARWTASVHRTDTGEDLTVTANFLWMCHGYYDHDNPHRPTWPGEENFRGPIVHPQQWPDDLDCTDRRVVIIGSGSTATTLAPVLAQQAQHVTMLQRSPSYYFIAPKVHELAEALAPLDLPPEWTHEILRRQYVLQTDRIVSTSRDAPDEARAFLLDGIRDHVPDHVDFDRHFSPAYRPWQERLVAIPDGDFFRQLQAGALSVATDTIKRFTEDGVLTDSGELLPADVIVAATGLTLNAFADIPFRVDGAPVDFGDRVTWRGVMIEGIPNMAFLLGYIRYSWTLRLDIVNDLVARLLQTMDEAGSTVVTPTLRPGDTNMVIHPWVAEDNVSSGYIRRAVARLYKQGDREPWQQMFEYDHERTVFPTVDLDDGLQYR